MKAPRVPVHERVRACFALTLSMKQLFPYCKILEDTFMDLANNGEYPALRGTTNAGSLFNVRMVIVFAWHPGARSSNQLLISCVFPDLAVCLLFPSLCPGPHPRVF